MAEAARLVETIAELEFHYITDGDAEDALRTLNILIRRARAIRKGESRG